MDALSALVGVTLTWRVRSESALLVSRREAIEAKRSGLQHLDEPVSRFQALKAVVENRKTIIADVRDRQSAAATLLSALGESLDPLVEIRKAEMRTGPQ